MVGGVGVANAVRAYLDGKRGVIATFKSLGASGGFVFTVYLVQILMIAGLGIVLGLILGALMPFAASAALQSVIPVPAEGGLYPGALAMAALFGLLVTLAFALLPLGRARDVPATALFREMGFEGRGFPRLPYRRPRRSASRSLLAALAILFSGDQPHRLDLRRRHGLCLSRAAPGRRAGAVGGAQKPACALRRRSGSPSATSIGPAR